MRKFNSPVNLKAAADSFVSEAFIDVTLTELVSAHSIARPLLALHFRLKKWCDLVNGFGAECAWSISSVRLQSAAQALIDYGYLSIYEIGSMPFRRGCSEVVWRYIW